MMLDPNDWSGTGREVIPVMRRFWTPDGVRALEARDPLGLTVGIAEVEAMLWSGADPF